jgi:hypothetical protein
MNEDNSLDSAVDPLVVRPGVKKPRTRRSSFVSRALWWCAAADANVLERCPIAERARYEGLGGSLLTTAALAWLSGSFAALTVLEPGVADPSSASRAVALGLGALWAAIMFNMDRFIVTNVSMEGGMAKGLWAASGRLVLAGIIGIVVATPLELKIFDTEIGAAIALAEQEDFARRDAVEDDASRRHAQLLGVDDVTGECASIEQRMQTESCAQQRTRAAQATDDFTTEMKDGSSGRRPGKGLVANALQQQQGVALAALDTCEQNRQRLNDSLEQCNAKKAELRDRVARGASEDVERLPEISRDGLAARIRVLHTELSDIGLWITLLFLAVEVMPVLSKVFMPSGAYEMIQANERAVAMARMGMVEEAPVLDASGREHRAWVNVRLERIRAKVLHGFDRIRGHRRPRSGQDAASEPRDQA